MWWQGTGVGGVGLDGEAVVGWAHLCCLLVSMLSLSSDVVESLLCCSTLCFMVLVEFWSRVCSGVGLDGFWGFAPGPQDSFAVAKGVGKVRLS